MGYLQVLEWSATALSLLGALLVAGRTATRRRRGFEIWIVANCLWIAWAGIEGKWGVLTMFAAYQATSVWGWRNNSSLPVVAEESELVESRR